MTDQLVEARGRVEPHVLRRFIAPQSVAVIGASESSPRHAVRALLDSDLDVFLVNPRHEQVFGRDAFPTLTAIGRPVDAVLTLVNANVAVSVVQEAATAGAAGVAINAAGFAEAGPEGVALQRRLVEAAGDSLAVLGPNCNGFINVQRDAFLAGAPRLPLREGSIGFITHSGGFITDIAVAAAGREIGFSSLISTGNEAVTDMVDYIEYFVDDPDTRVICLVIERIARPRAFFAAVDRAREASKPVIALKLGKSVRGLDVARSHTGSIVGESWVYEAAFRQFGIVSADDLEDLLDRALFFDQLPQTRWSAVSGLAVMSVSGGAATLAGDLCEAEGIPLPELAGLQPDIKAVLPQATTMNPIDLTGFVMAKPEVVQAVVETYERAPDVDALVALWTLGLESRGFADAFLLPFAATARESRKPFILSSTAGSDVSPWAAELMAHGIGVGRGLRGTVRGLAAMREFVTRAPLEPWPTGTNETIPPPELDAVVDTAAGPMLRFEAAMAFLDRCGIPVADYELVPAGAAVADLAPAFAGPYAVKLADCPHRTEVGGVLLGVDAPSLPDAVVALRRVAEEHGLPQDIAVQPQLRTDGELFVGAETGGELGPVIVGGVGGIHVEAVRAVAGRLVPLRRHDALELLEDADPAGLLAGTRGSTPFDRGALAELIESTSHVVHAARAWLASLDVNPLVWTDGSYAAVDALVIVRGVNA